MELAGLLLLINVEAGLAAGDLKISGEGLHPFEDSWSHRGVPSIKGFAGHSNERGGRFSTATDIPWKYPNEALEAAHETFKYMQRFAAQHPEYAHHGQCRSWESIASEVMEYIRLQERFDERDKRRILRESLHKSLECCGKGKLG